MNSEWWEIIWGWKCTPEGMLKPHLDARPDHPILNLEVDRLDLDAETRNCLVRAGLTRVRDVLCKHPGTLLAIQDFDTHCLVRLEEALGKQELEMGVTGSVPKSSLARYVLQLTLQEFLQQKFVREVLRKRAVAKQSLLYSQHLSERVRKKIPPLVRHASDQDNPTVAVFLTMGLAELRLASKIGPEGLNWLATYLGLFGLELHGWGSSHQMPCRAVN